VTGEKMEKVIKDGKVAILISPGFGAGWYSWNADHKELLFHPKLVAMVESGRNAEINDEWVKENLSIDIYTGGAESLKIHWLPEGTAFQIEEYDGAESIRTLEDLTFIA
jgi:hypothetical protein